MEAFMTLVGALVLFQVLYFLVLFTGELTRWLFSMLGETYRNNKRQVGTAQQPLTSIN
ncbi:MAG: hypothetical protein SGJ24_19995 [Chloroflexota bacterium]|nr:hypothetical protein [Chloroflexota bacterium]